MATFPLDNFSLSPLGLGSWPFGAGYDWGPCDQRQAQEAVLSALEAGINWIDTAPIYGGGESETFLGRTLQGRRAQVVLAGKCGLIKNGSWTDHNLCPEAIRKQLEDSLLRLKTDYLDIYQIHYPDPKVPLEDAVGTLVRLGEEGKIRAIGLCNVTSAQLETAAKIAPIFSVQNEFSLLHPQAGQSVLKACLGQSILFMGYGVLCGGILSGKYKTAPNLRRADARNYFYKCYRDKAFVQAQQVTARVKKLAEQKNLPAAALAIAWALSVPGVSCVLAGARSPQQVRQNIKGMALRLSAAEKLFLEQADESE